MIAVSSSNKFIIACIHKIPNFFNFTGNTVNIFFWGYSLSFSQLLYFLSVFIGSGTETDVIAHISFKAGNSVGQHNFICVSDMGFS